MQRTLYRAGCEQAVVPLELRAGIIGGHWTPLAAHQASFLVAHLTPREGAAVLRELGRNEKTVSGARRSAWTFIVPILLLHFVVKISPSVSAVGPAEFIGLENFRRLRGPLLLAGSLAQLAVAPGHHSHLKLKDSIRLGSDASEIGFLNRWGTLDQPS